MNELSKTIIKRIYKSKFVQKKYILPLKEKYLSLHTVTEIGDGAYRITEAGIFNAFLFVGDKKALLVDTGLGIKGFTDAIKSITTLPLTVVATNGHIGAVGGAGQFDSVYIDKADIRDAKVSTNQKVRKAFYFILPTRKLFKLTGDDLTMSAPRFEKLGKLQSFDLGGREVRVIHTPSHTKGSCCYCDSKSSIIITGEMLLPVVSMLMPHSATMEQFSISLNRISHSIDSGDNYGLVGYTPLDRTRTHEIMKIVEEVGNYCNDYSRIVAYKLTDDKKRALIYYPAKMKKRKMKQKMGAIINKM